MRFLVDECTGPVVARWLREQKHDVFSVYDEDRGMDDDKILKKAFDENWILITNDKDFGEKVFKEKYPHKGVVFLRIEDERSKNKIDTIKRLLYLYSDQISNNFVVVSENQVRFARKQVTKKT